MKYAWVEDERIRDIAPGNPYDWYTAEVAAYYDTEVPDDAENGDGWVDGHLVKPQPVPPPPPPEPTPPPPRTWTDKDFHAAMTLSEKVKWDNNQSPQIVTAKKEMATPQEEPYTTEILDMLVGSGDISVATKQKILA